MKQYLPYLKFKSGHIQQLTTHNASDRAEARRFIINWSLDDIFAWGVERGIVKLELYCLQSWEE